MQRVNLASTVLHNPFRVNVDHSYSGGAQAVTRGFANNDSGHCGMESASSIAPVPVSRHRTDFSIETSQVGNGSTMSHAWTENAPNVGQTTAAESHAPEWPLNTGGRLHSSTVAGANGLVQVQSTTVQAKRVVNAEPDLARNCPPSILQGTLQRFPPEPAIDLPVGVVVSPFVEDLPSTDVQIGGLLRCATCFGYANAFSSFQLHARKWTCPFCSTLNTIVDSTSIDMSRPEYTTGAVDYDMEKVDSSRADPKKPCFVFVLDVSASAVNSGALRTMADAIVASLDCMAVNAEMRVALMTFDDNVHFFDLRSSVPKMITIADLDDPFIPDNANFLLPLAEARQGLEYVLQSFVPSLTTSAVPAQNCFVSAVKAACCLIETNGGNVMAMSSGFPTVGAEAEANLAARSAKHSVKAASKEFRNISTAASVNKISINAFIVSEHFCDLASLWPLTIVGGRLRKYGTEASDLDALRADVVKQTTTMHAYECVLRVRLSKGWEVDRYYGATRCVSNGLLIMNAASKDATMSFTLKRAEEYSTAQVNERRMFAQVCAVYTDNSGARRLRVMTNCFEVSPEAGDVNPSAMSAIVAHKAMSLAQVEGVERGRQFITLVARCAAQHNLQANNLIHAHLAQKEWSTLLYYLFGLLRSAAFRRFSKLSGSLADERIQFWSKVATLPCAGVAGMLTPSLWRVNDLVEHGSAATNLPLSSQSLTDTESYLMYNGIAWLLWNGAHSLEPCDVSAESTNDVGRAVKEFIAHAHAGWCADRGALYSIVQGRPNDALREIAFFEELLEDPGQRPDTKVGYREWVDNLARAPTASCARPLAARNQGF